ncbi:MAG: response regulator transcription factor [Flaviflexus sp.]|uniref:response regulator n=1 Tax=Flaviflexus sp. TaxID=1969482 RepID=UPI00352E6642
MIRVVLADDHPVVRAGIRAMISADPELTIVGEASDTDQAISLARELVPDVVLMDLQFGTEQTGADATRIIKQQSPAPAVLVLTNYDTDGDILSAVEAGASGYLLKDAPPEELIIAIKAAAAGETALAPAIAGRLMARMRSPQTSLSSREAEVLQLVADGEPNTSIARILHISNATVKTHLVHIYSKLGVSSRTAAVATAREAGLIR